jgi:hypothetical protein
MKMIPLVRATEPGKAQIENLHLCRIVVLRSKTRRSARRKSCWKTASERVRIPYAVEALFQQFAFLESRTLELVRK